MTEQRKNILINDALNIILTENKLPTEKQWNDRLDFPEVAVWTLRSMLEKAYHAGYSAAKLDTY